MTQKDITYIGKIVANKYKASLNQRFRNQHIFIGVKLIKF